MANENIETSALQAGGIDITYFTDPLCCWSWAFEPEWRKLRFEFEGLITWNYCMGGLLPGWNNYVDTVNSVSRPAQMGPVWMHASYVSGMHIENSIWMKDPPVSSYPACIAVKCAQLQSAEYGEQYLRLLRENLMLKGINISKHKVLIELADKLAQQSKNFNKDLFQQYLFGKEGLEAFKADVQQAKNYNINRFPTLIFKNLQQSVIITGYRPYSALLQALQQLLPGIKPTKKINSENEYKSYWLSITEREVKEAFK